MGKSYRWTRDELILALAVYIAAGKRQLPATDPEVIALARCIGRTPASVNMRLGNFLSVDPSYSGEGLRGGYDKCRAVWDEFAHVPAHLRATAEVIRRRIASDSRRQQ